MSDLVIGFIVGLVFGVGIGIALAFAIITWIGEPEWLQRRIR